VLDLSGEPEDLAAGLGWLQSLGIRVESLPREDE
jgi:hypothetical protein